MLKLILFNRCSQQKMDRLAYDLGRRSCEICLDAILFFVIEVERHHLEQACEHIVQAYRMAVVIVLYTAGTKAKDLPIMTTYLGRSSDGSLRQITQNFRCPGRIGSCR